MNARIKWLVDEMHRLKSSLADSENQRRQLASTLADRDEQLRNLLAEQVLSPPKIEGQLEVCTFKTVLQTF